VESRGPITKLNAEIDAGIASEAKKPAVRLGFGVSEGREFFGPRIGKRKCVSWRFYEREKCMEIAWKINQLCSSITV
jgi:hypothetical protein